MPDQFFTPPSVARRLVSFFRASRVDFVADFAAGDGELLRAATEKWPEAECFATDIDPKCVASLRRSHPDWTVGKCDFLNEKSKRGSGVLSSIEDGVGLVLLNPPFSCKGNSTHYVETEAGGLRCSTAMAFVLSALPYLGANGKLVAVLPASSMKSRKDASAWERIGQDYEVRSVASFGLRTFRDCAANTVVVRLQAKTNGAHKQKFNDTQPVKKKLSISAVLVRGCVPMHAARNGLAGANFDLVHTTDMRKKNVTRVEHGLRVKRRSTTGPSVLMPRVGCPSKDKCVLYLGRKQLVLSDCVYAIRCGSTSEAKMLQSTILANWDLVAQCYSGTCAPYLTIEGLTALLQVLGVTLSKVEANVKPSGVKLKTS